MRVIAISAETVGGTREASEPGVSDVVEAWNDKHALKRAEKNFGYDPRTGEGKRCRLRGASPGRWAVICSVFTGPPGGGRGRGWAFSDCKAKMMQAHEEGRVTVATSQMHDSTSPCPKLRIPAASR